jgi:eukaryotic-like serine/threonine-protein kinase
MADAGSLGDYQLLHRLAVGGQGEVFLARQRGIAGFDRLAVVKRLLPDVLESEEHLALFLDEARISANLTHPNIVSIYELGEANGEYFLSMEYVAGQNLGRLLMRTSQARQRLPLDVAAFIVHELAVALEYAHHAADADGRPLGIVHRDISPSNALISYRGDVKLMDFGIAKAANRESVSRTGVLRGKFPYMSPEQVRGEAVDARSDIFSLGVVLWETTLGRRLFKGASDVETLKLVEQAPIASPVEIETGGHRGLVSSPQGYAPGSASSSPMYPLGSVRCCASSSPPRAVSRIGSYARR